MLASMTSRNEAQANTRAREFAGSMTPECARWNQGISIPRVDLPWEEGEAFAHSLHCFPSAGSRDFLQCSPREMKSPRTRAFLKEIFLARSEGTYPFEKKCTWMVFLKETIRLRPVPYACAQDLWALVVRRYRTPPGRTPLTITVMTKALL